MYLFLRRVCCLSTNITLHHCLPFFTDSKDTFIYALFFNCVQSKKCKPAFTFFTVHTKLIPSAKLRLHWERAHTSMAGNLEFYVILLWQDILYIAQGNISIYKRKKFQWSLQRIKIHGWSWNTKKCKLYSAGQLQIHYIQKPYNITQSSPIFDYGGRLRKNIFTWSDDWNWK